MIRVNLLAAGPVAPRVLLPPERRPALVGLLMLSCTLGGLYGWWRTIGRDVAAVEAEIAESRRELAQLEAAATLVERAMTRRAELSGRLALIERLRSAQHGPVTLLSAVSHSLPDGLWLTELKQRGIAVQMEGRATSLTAVADFAERLQSSGSFRGPVEIATGIELVDEASVVRFAVTADLVESGLRPAAGTDTARKGG